MAFKLGSEKRRIRTPWNVKKSPTVYQKKLEEGIDAEANMDGSIFIDPSVPLGSERFKRTIKHEAKHLIDMETGKAAYGDDWVMWDGKIYIRKTIDGEKVIDGPAGRLPEGHPDHPWEESAIKAETDPNVSIEVESVEVQKIEPEDVESMPEPGESPNKLFGILGAASLAGGLLGKKNRGSGEAIEGEGGDGHTHDEEGNVVMPEEEAGSPEEEISKEKKKAAEGGAWEKFKKANSKIGSSIGKIFSDRRLKKDIKLIGESPSGLNIYTFKYVDEMCDSNTYEGVMSDEIPSSAIVKNDSGYDMVDYSQLDVDFKKI